MKPLFIVNPNMMFFEKKYIAGCNSKTFDLFLQLCEMRVKINGFLQTDDDSESTFFHLPILPFEGGDNGGGSSVIIDPYCEIQDSERNLCREPIQIDQKINKDHVVIYGAGYIGKLLGEYIGQKGYHIDFYVETDNKEGKVIDGTPVRSLSYLLNNYTPDTSLVVAGRFYREIEEVIKKTGKIDTDDIFFWANDSILKIRTEDVLTDTLNDYKINKSNLIFIEEHWGDKEIILYGDNDELKMKSYKDFFVCMGYDNTIIATDSSKLSKLDDEENVIDIVDVIYRSNYVVFLFDYSKKNILDNLGLIETENYVSAYFTTIVKIRELQIDVNLGHVMFTDGFRGKMVCPGITVFGDEDGNNLRILALGGSCTEDGRNKFESWPEFLYKILKADGVDCTVFNGGCSGYTSAQELLKLIRDGVLLNPDIIISYSGVNEYSQKPEKQYDFKFPELVNIFDFVQKKNPGKVIVSGYESSIPVYDKWLMNERMMNSVAECFGSEFYCFFQPSLLAMKGYKTKRIKKLDRMLDAISDDGRGRPKYVNAREKAALWSMENDFMHDMSGLFDGKDVYIDASHVNKEGNKMIAEFIYSVIKNGQKIMERRS